MQVLKFIFGFTYDVIKNEYTYGKLKYDGSMTDYRLEPPPPKKKIDNQWTAPNQSVVLGSGIQSAGTASWVYVLIWLLPWH